MKDCKNEPDNIQLKSYWEMNNEKSAEPWPLFIYGLPGHSFLHQNVLHELSFSVILHTIAKSESDNKNLLQTFKN